MEGSNVVSETKLLEWAGKHINTARDALMEMTDGEGNLAVSDDDMIYLHRIAYNALEEAICQIPVELVPNPRTIEHFLRNREV